MTRVHASECARNLVTYPQRPLAVDVGAYVDTEVGAVFLRFLARCEVQDGQRNHPKQPRFANLTVWI
jgi:hypothetical protein